MPALAACGLVALTLAVFAPVRGFEFVNFDDPGYVNLNARVRAGLSLANLRWALTATTFSNWHPLTWLSHMLDVQLFGFDAGRHHLTNLALHAAATVVLFAALRRATGALWRSAFVAALFAVHPLHVESVVWIAERKDVLSAFFWMLTLWAYVRYVEAPSARAYVPVAAAFAAGLAAKPMLVTLPCVLLLLDVWPLGRTSLAPPARALPAGARRAPPRRLLGEKVPLFALAAGASVLTLIAQHESGAIAIGRNFAPTLRAANALRSYLVYIRKTLWPVDLAVFYPHPLSIPLWQTAGAAAALTAVSALALATVRRRPYLAVGWFWYLGTLVPVIGLLQVGTQAMADRYTYLPLVGLFIAAAWGAGDLLARRAVALGLAGVAVLAASALVCARQVATWRNSIALFEHAVAVTSGNALAHVQLAAGLSEAGRFEDAIAEYRTALAIAPDYAVARNSLGVELERQGRLDEAIAQFEEALRLAEDYPDAHYNLGNALRASGRADEAAAQYARALALQADHAQTHNNLGDLLRAQGDGAGAIAHFEAALRADPDYVDAHVNLGSALRAEGRLDDAIAHLETAVRLRPDSADAHYNLANALAARVDLEEAAAHYARALELRPDFALAHNNLGLVLARQGRLDDAIAEFSETLRLDDQLAIAWGNRARAYHLKGDEAAAAADAERARALGWTR